MTTVTRAILADKYRDTLDNGMVRSVGGFSEGVLREILYISMEEGYNARTIDITVGVSFAECEKEAIVMRKENCWTSRALDLLNPFFGIGKRLLVSPAVPRGVYIGLSDSRDSELAGKLVTYFLDQGVMDLYLNNERI